MRRRKRRLLLRVLAAVLAVSAVVLFAARYYSATVNRLKDRIAELNLSLDSYERSETETVRVCTASTELTAGTVITVDDIALAYFPINLVPVDAAANQSTLSGKILRIDVSKGTCFTEGMLADDSPDEDIREIEYACIDIRGNIGIKSVIDVRILFPDGTDYVVLAGKRVSDLSEDFCRVSLCLNEEEILRMDSAMVDAAVFTGTRLYAVEYPESCLQSISYVNYTPSEAVIGLILSDPNISRVLSNYLDAGERRTTERRLTEYED